MNKIKIYILILLTFLVLPIFKIRAQTKTLTIHYFYSKTCPHCIEESAFLDKMEEKYPTLSIERHEINEKKENVKLLIETGKRLNITAGGVPFLVIGSDYTIGYMDDETTGAEIEQKILKALENPPFDLVGTIEKDGHYFQEETSKTPQFISLPIAGKLNVKTVSLPVLTIIIGLLDGVNPCAMWILLFLISLLLGMENRKKMWILGGTFIASSALVYFLFLSAWLNFFLLVGYSHIIKVAIGFLASGIGMYYLWDYKVNKDGGCETVKEESRVKWFDKVKKVVQRDSLILAAIGLFGLAFAVNIIELLCSLGLPAIYTKVLSMAHLPTWQYYLYLLLYLLMFMLDDIIIFVIAMLTFQATGVGSKYSRYSHLLGGIIMLLIGIFMLFKPELLMFS
jgi:glutaredoxin